MKTLEKLRLIFCLAFTGLSLSCSDIFTTSLASWAQRDPSSLIPAVTSSNVDKLILLTERSPDQSLALLKRIAEAAPSPELQAAALAAAANASGLGAAILQYAGDIDSISSANAADIVTGVLNGLSNIVEAEDVLKSILPAPGALEWNSFKDAAGAGELAMAAAVLLAGEAKKSGNPENYINSFPLSPTTGTVEDLAKELAGAAKDKYTGGGFLEDLLNGLHLL